MMVAPTMHCAHPTLPCRLSRSRKKIDDKMALFCEEGYFCEFFLLVYDRVGTVWKKGIFPPYALEPKCTLT